MGGPRKPTAELIASGTHMSAKHLEAHERGEEIDRRPKIWREFEWKCKSKNKGDRVIEFFKTFITHTTGEWAGKKFKFIPWQTRFLKKLFGTLKKDGYRQFKQAYLEIGKKNGKSEIAAGVCLYLLIADDEGGPEIVLAASDREQATIIYSVCAQMVRNNQQLSECLKVLSSNKRILYIKGNGVLKVVSHESYSKHGLNLSGCVIDELHAQQTRDLYDVLTKGSGAARRQPLFLFLTTAGYDRTSICYEVHEYAEKVEKKTINDPTFLPVIYAVDAEKDWEDEKNWKDANPSLGYIFGIENLREVYRKAKILPAEEGLFRRLRLNQWTNQETKWIPLTSWDKCKGKVDASDLLKRTCYGGLDLSSTTALSALALLFPSEDLFELLLYFWMPQDQIIARGKQDKVNYDLWVKQGLIETCPGNIIDYQFIRAKLGELATQFNIEEIAFDPWNASQLTVQLEQDGFKMVELRQGFASLSAPTKELEKVVIGNKIHHGGNPVMRWMMDNVVVLSDPAGNIKPDKSKSYSRIDGVIATIMALDRTSRGGKKESVYETRGLVVIGEGEQFEEIENESQISGTQVQSASACAPKGPICPRCENSTEGKPFCPKCGKKQT